MKLRFEDREFIYVTFRSAYGFFLDLNKLDKKNFRLSSIRRIDNLNEDNEINWCYEATVCLNRNAVLEFLTKVEDYIHQNTRWGNPVNRSLIANIEQSELQQLQVFGKNLKSLSRIQESVWWEVWLHREPEDNIENPLEPFYRLN